jgi:predicted DNA-binding transcriptional regulator YafY
MPATLRTLPDRNGPEADGILADVTATTPARLLRLLSLMQSRREWSGAGLAERLGVTDRTVRRDMGRLRELGYPVEATTGTAGGYRLGSGQDLPPLLLDDDEAVAVAIGLLTAAGTAGVEDTALRALAKLTQVLPARLRRRVTSVGEATVPLPDRRGAPADPTVLGMLAAAVRDHEIVTFGHRRRDGSATQRRVEPYRMLAGYGLWYLLAFDLTSGDWRTFRVDRITGPASARLRFTQRPLPTDDVATFLRRAITTAPYRYTAMVTVPAPADVVAARLPSAIPGRVTAVDATTSTVRLSSDSLDRLTQDVVALGTNATVHASAEVVSHLHVVAAHLAATRAG